MTALLILGICALVLLVLLLPFRRPRQAPPGHEASPWQPTCAAATSDQSRLSAGSAAVHPTAAAGEPASEPAADARPDGPAVSAGAPGESASDEPCPAPAEASPDETTARLRGETDRLLQALADLRFDYEAGKLSREDFEEEDAQLRMRAAEVLRKIEEGPS